ncbi:response regulator [Candidatus Woesearchaeota archaeon]|nr:response regulator [Candidatus Woesearchaeota archaeon]
MCICIYTVERESIYPFDYCLLNAHSLSNLSGCGFLVETRPILLVEDNSDDTELTQRAFKKCNIANELIIIRDGAEALEFILRNCRHSGGSANGNQLPGVVLLDLKLPKVNGLEVLKAIRSNSETRFLPVMILTSSKEEEDMLTGFKLGANSFIRKPIDFKQFSHAVQQLGLYWLVLNDAPLLKKPDANASFKMHGKGNSIVFS